MVATHSADPLTHLHSLEHLFRALDISHRRLVVAFERSHLLLVLALHLDHPPLGIQDPPVCIRGRGR